MENYTVDEYALCTRFKSKRRKERLVKEDFEKHLIQLRKREKELWKKRKDLPLIPLENPYQKGWQRCFVLREDVVRSSEAEFYRTLLEKINTWQFSSEKSFKRKKKRKRKHVYVEKLQTVKEFSEWEWKSPKLELTEKEKVHFYKRERWCSNFKRDKIHYVFNEPWRYILRVSPYMITHTKMVDSDLESEIQLLENYIVNLDLRNKINRLIHGSSLKWSYYEKENPKETSPIKNKSLNTLYQQYLDEMI
ncbi:hypothetical protein [Flavobacterium johnsoniae]|uniref:Uncharacterized protein n=1 Tax=Flavobacterium johnsoniae (strain ATCC 17061 / DSM 2064 / JCM 8514 / BCRC 14874 / CCUG 350202 / NBRC 14942 / NCIMB 11054 / UW101) TaxID=376686 RepID=A5FEA2_FLAJ1|nr:hypothetical protein [Flavobacterium johnsoniae]ABQ06473.1 hypothetical protein Fjoh_3459 [Flavobacterium johnsoniae UW101]OXE98147.1 hypothetical protein B0A63_16145 [Flavobacterium johnsoniae UW101]WQG82224.1 hypothetical protein SR927_03725 [Flavobacterium johnsoniae UW101]SHK76629.1 hypothetical protein SAMN05444146_2206 [Flavobacterium johnsoniae]